MNESMSQGSLSQGFLGLDDAAFWSQPVLSFETKCRVLQGEPGVHLDGPKLALLEERQTIPYLGTRVTKGTEHLRVGLRGKACLVTLRESDNRCWVGAAFRGSLSEAPIALRQASQEASDDTSAEHFEVDLQVRLGVVLEPGIHRTWVVLFDTASNPVSTEVRAPEIGDPEVAALVKKSRAAIYAGPVSPQEDKPLPSYRAVAGSPAVPTEAGVVIDVPRVTVAKPDSQVLVRGSFRLPVLQCELVDPALRPEMDRRWREAGAQGSPPVVPTAVVTIHLLLVGNTQSAPELLRLAVPIWAPIKVDNLANELVTGHFALDLRQHLALDAQTYAVWTLAAGQLRGPLFAALVSPDMLPRQGG